MAVGVIVIWSLHDGGKEDKQAKFFFFHKDDLYLKADTDLDETSIVGGMGGALFVDSELDERQFDECAAHDQETKWCFTWKEKTTLHVDYVDRTTMQCITVNWQNISAIFPTDCYELKRGYWYGIGGKEKWLANKNPLAQDYYLPGYDEQNNNVYDFYLLSSHGTSIYITSEDPFLLSHNDTGDSKLCISPVAVGPRMHTSLSYEVCQSNNMLTTHAGSALYSHEQPNTSVKINLTAYEEFAWKVGSPDELINLTKITGAMDRLISRGHKCGNIEIGFQWETHIGDFEFDPSVLNGLNILKTYNCKFILPISPVVSYMSKLFDFGIRNNMFVQYLYQKSVRLYNYGNVQGAMLDISLERVKTFMAGKLQALAEKINIATFKVRKIPVSVHTASADRGRFSASGIFRGWFDLVNVYNKSALMGNVYRLQDTHVLVDVSNDVYTNADNQSCLINPLPTVFTLGLDGYPNIMSSLNDPEVSAELLIRWLQYSVFFTGLTFPSESLLLKDGSRLFINKAKKFREAFVFPLLRSLQSSNSQPILLPLWWHYSSDENVFEIEDQFLFNETILIAPIFCTEQKSRDIYLPAVDGIWSHPSTGKDYTGGKWLRNFSVDLHEIPYFKVKIVY